MNFPDPGLDVFLGHKVRFDFEAGGTAYHVGPEHRTNGWTCLSFRSPAGALIALDLDAGYAFAGRALGWQLRIDGVWIASGGDTKSITDKTLRRLVEQALTAISRELARRAAADVADQQRRADRAVKRV
jgi:hypothetical protein